MIANKLRQIDVDMKIAKRRGKVVLQRCRITRPSGRAELDLVPCEVAQQCVADGVTGRKQLVACTEQRSQVRLDGIIAAWRKAS